MRLKTRTSWNPAARIVSMYSRSTAAPPMQSAQSCGFSPHTAPTSTCTTMSASWSRPPCFSSPENLPERGGLVRHEVQDSVARDHVGARIGEWDPCCVPLEDLHVLRTHPLDVRTRLRDHRGRDVEPIDLPRSPGLEGRIQHIRPGAGSDVED